MDSDDGFNGLSGWAGDVPVIVLVNWLDRDLPRKRLTALHELGHLVTKLPEDTAKKEEEHLSFRLQAPPAPQKAETPHGAQYPKVRGVGGVVGWSLAISRSVSRP